MNCEFYDRLHRIANGKCVARAKHRTEKGWALSRREIIIRIGMILFIFSGVWQRFSRRFIPLKLFMFVNSLATHTNIRTNIDRSAPLFTDACGSGSSVLIIRWFFLLFRCFASFPFRCCCCCVCFPFVALSTEVADCSETVMANVVAATAMLAVIVRLVSFR